MVRKMRLAGELATAGVLAAAATVGMVTSDGTPHRVVSAVPVGASGRTAEATSTSPSTAPRAAYPLPAVPLQARTTAASSGRSVRHSAWRGSISRPAARQVDDIPVRALESYQRAATVIDQADPSCHLDWPLLAAIAKVESDHGRYAGASVDDDGQVRPLVLGPRLTGAEHTRRVADTDAGRLDGDRHVDRALGPFQIVPATWAQVRVDADGDGRRDPNDVDDAALAASVFLCSGRDDLATGEGQRQAVRRYNPDGGYVRLVMHVMRGYEQAAVTVVVPVGIAVGTAGPLPSPFTPPPAPASPEASFVGPDEPTWSEEPTSAPAAPSPTSAPSPWPSAEPSPTEPVTVTSSPTPTPTAPESPTATETAPSAATTAPPTACPTTDQYGVVRATASALLRSNGSACM